MQPVLQGFGQQVRPSGEGEHGERASGQVERGVGQGNLARDHPPSLNGRDALGLRYQDRGAKSEVGVQRLRPPPTAGQVGEDRASAEARCDVVGVALQVDGSTQQVVPGEVRAKQPIPE